MANKAEYQLSSSMNDGFLEIIITGKLTETNKKKIIDELCNVTKEKNVKKVLIDLCKLNGRLGILESYDIIRNYPPHMYNILFATVDIPENADYQSYCEVTALNAGQKGKCFTDIDEARVWLKSK